MGEGAKGGGACVCVCVCVCVALLLSFVHCYRGVLVAGGRGVLSSLPCYHLTITSLRYHPQRLTRAKILEEGGGGEVVVAGRGVPVSHVSLFVIDLVWFAKRAGRRWGFIYSFLEEWG